MKTIEITQNVFFDYEVYLYNSYLRKINCSDDYFVPTAYYFSGTNYIDVTKVDPQECYFYTLYLYNSKCDVDGNIETVSLNCYDNSTFTLYEYTDLKIAADSSGTEPTFTHSIESVDLQNNSSFVTFDKAEFIAGINIKNGSNFIYENDISVSTNQLPFIKIMEQGQLVARDNAPVLTFVMPQHLALNNEETHQNTLIHCVNGFVDVTGIVLDNSVGNFLPIKNINKYDYV